MLWAGHRRSRNELPCAISLFNDGNIAMSSRSSRMGPDRFINVEDDKRAGYESHLTQEHHASSSMAWEIYEPPPLPQLELRSFEDISPLMRSPEKTMLRPKGQKIPDPKRISSPFARALRSQHVDMEQRVVLHQSWAVCQSG